MTGSPNRRLRPVALAAVGRGPAAAISALHHSPGGLGPAPGLAIHTPIALEIPNDVGHAREMAWRQHGPFGSAPPAPRQRCEPAARPGADAPGLGRVSASNARTSKIYPGNLERNRSPMIRSDLPINTGSPVRRLPSATALADRWFQRRRGPDPNCIIDHIIEPASMTGSCPGRSAGGGRRAGL